MSGFAGVEAFVFTAELRSFRAAARRLEVTPAAVSKAVAGLEARLGARLLDRTSRRVRLTPEGALYLARARAALDALQAGADEVATARDAPSGRLTVSLPFVLGRPLVSALPRLTERHPRLSLDLRFTDRPVKLLEEGVDVAVRVGALDDSELVARRLRDLRWVTAASPDYLAARGTPRTPAELAGGHTCLKFRAPSGVDVEWQFAASRGGEGRAVRLPTRHRMDQGDLLVEAAAAGLGVVQAFDFMLAPWLERGALVEVLAHQAAAGPALHALCRPGQQRTARVRAFFDFLTGCW
jgi:LysR family transcriptional regulator for bpeEF and oprC